MSRFVVDLGDMKLDDKQKHDIASSIQKSVLAQLASHAHPPKQAFFFPRDWIGLIARLDLNQFQAAEAAAKTYVAGAP